MPSPKIDRRIQEEWKMLFSLSIILIVLFVIGEIIFIWRKAPDILAETEPYLTPLPESLNIERLDTIYDKTRKMPLTPEKFINSIDRQKLNLLRDRTTNDSE